MSTQSLTLVDVPRPYLDTIASTAQALSVFSLTVRRPFRRQHLVLLVDASRHGVGLHSCDVVLLVDASRHGVGLHSCDGFINLRDDPTTAGRSLGHHVVSVASTHPLASGCYVMTVEPDSHASPNDTQRWLAMADVCDRAGILLIDWCVRGFATAGARYAGQGTVWFPRHAAGPG